MTRSTSREGEATGNRLNTPYIDVRTRDRAYIASLILIVRELWNGWDVFRHRLDRLVVLGNA